MLNRLGGLAIPIQYHVQLTFVNILLLIGLTVIYR